MSRCDIDSDWTTAANGASFAWMAKSAKHGPTAERSGDLKSRLSLEIARIASLALDDLRAAWSAEFRKQPSVGLSRDWLVRTLAWRLQEKAFGGHDKVTLKLLDAHARGKGMDALFHKLKSGTVLVREYRGARYTVTIVEGGFLWQDQVYSNLSAIACAITGTNWNGPRFFGLRQAGRGRARKETAQLPACPGEGGQAPENEAAGANG
jgi:hypothetical protein